MSRAYFFATGADLILLLWHLEERFDLVYSDHYNIDAASRRKWTRASDLPDFGRATAEQEIACEAFDIRSAEPGDILDLVTLRKGGFWSDGSLISGHLIAQSNGVFARRLMNRTRSGLKKYFTKINAFWVGPEALRAFRSGTRLCNAIQSPPEYDLREFSPLSE
jgi:hypothetical protein